MPKNAKRPTKSRTDRLNLTFESNTTVENFCRQNQNVTKITLAICFVARINE